LLLASEPSAVDRAGEPCAITDTQLDQTNARFRPAASLRRGTPEHDAAWRAYSRELEDARNQPGGYWLAAADPVATGHFLRASGVRETVPKFFTGMTGRAISA
jgi:hypothetical protein